MKHRSFSPLRGGLLALLLSVSSVPGLALAQSAARSAPAPGFDVQASVTNDELALQVTGFPLVAGPNDSTLVVAVETHLAMNAPNLSLRFLDRATGRTTRTLDVLTVEQGVRLVRGNTVTPAQLAEVRARITEALTAVRALGAARSLTATSVPQEPTERRATVPVNVNGAVAWTLEVGVPTIRAWRGATSQGAPAMQHAAPHGNAGRCGDRTGSVRTAYALPDGLLLEFVFRVGDLCTDLPNQWVVLHP